MEHVCFYGSLQFKLCALEFYVLKDSYLFLNNSIVADCITKHLFYISVTNVNIHYSVLAITKLELHLNKQQQQLLFSLLRNTLDYLFI